MISIEGLKIIGESINDSVPSTHQSFETEDFHAIGELARFQDANGAKVIDVNVGTRDPSVMRQAVKIVQEYTTLPLSIDSPDLEIAAAGLHSVDTSRGKPILNSISPLRMEMFDLYSEVPFQPILLISEKKNPDGMATACKTVDETFEAAVVLFEKAKSLGIPNNEIYFDAGIAPIATDTEGNLLRLLKTLEKINHSQEMTGVHASVGLSNFTVMLPSKKKDGSPIKSPLESAFLTLAMPLGLDTVIGSVKRKYQILPEDHDALIALNEILALSGFDCLKRLRKYYR